jgi:hypothetical protein
LILSGLALLAATLTRNNWWAVALITIGHGFVSGVGFGYLVQSLGSSDHALMPLAAMLIVSGCFYAAIKPMQQVGSRTLGVAH